MATEMTAYELWETQTGNLMASYARPADALDVVARTARVHGADRIMSFALLQVDTGGDVRTIAAGPELLALAEADAASRAATGESRSA